MTAPKFTPGEFRVVPTGLVRADVVAESGRPVCVNVLMADAYLFAAAPELYAKLKWLADWMRSVEGMSRNNLEELAWEEAGEIDALLAKARGEG